MQIRGVPYADQARYKDDGLVARSEQEVWESLSSRMGNLGTYRLLQINGQRKFFDPLDDSPPMPDGCEVFIGRVPRDMYEDELVPLFASIGPIHELRLMMNFSGTNRGFAFVMYKQPEYAKLAIVKLNNFQVRAGQLIGVIQSVNNRRLYVGKLPASFANNRDFRVGLKASTEGLVSVSFHVTKKAEKQRCFYALAVYRSHRHAAMARRFLILHKHDFFPQGVTVDWACPDMDAAISRRGYSTNKSPPELIKNSKSLLQNDISKKSQPSSPKKELRPTAETSSRLSNPVAQRFQHDQKACRPALCEMSPNAPWNQHGYPYGTNSVSYVRQLPPTYTLIPVPKQNYVPRWEPEHGNPSGNSTLLGFNRVAYDLDESSEFDLDRMLSYSKQCKRLAPCIKKYQPEARRIENGGEKSN